MILAWYATICPKWITISWFFPLFFTTILLNDTSEEIIDHDCHWGCPELTWFNWIVLMPFDYLFIHGLHSGWIFFVRLFVCFASFYSANIQLIISFIWY